MTTENINNNEPVSIKGVLTCSVCKMFSWLILAVCMFVAFGVVKTYMQAMVNTGNDVVLSEHITSLIFIASGVTSALLLRVLATIGENLIEINQRNKK